MPQQIPAWLPTQVVLIMTNRKTGKKEKSNTWVWVFLATSWACIILMGYRFGLYKYFTEKIEPQAAVSAISQKAAESPSCDATPPLKGRVSVAEAVGQKPNAAQAFIEIDNQHFFPVLLRFIDSRNSDTVIYADSHAKGRVELPAGSYTLAVQAGSVWCNLEKGFTDGYTLDNRDKVTVNGKASSSLRLIPIGPEPKDMILAFTTGDRMSVAGGDGKPLSLSRQMDGHFHVAGHLNGYPITFMVDTGASKTAIPFKIAKSLGLDRKCSPRKFRTAGGIVTGCLARAEELQFGGFILRQVDVTFTRSNEMSLLGMNVLSQFRIQQLDETMLITKR